MDKIPIKILMLVNWKVRYLRERADDLQPPDQYVYGEPYWFFRYFEQPPEVDVIDISSFKWLEEFEKNRVRFYIWQTLKAIPRLWKYDLIISHGMQSGVVLSLWRRFFKTKARHMVFDIGSFNSAAEHGLALRLMQFSSRSLDRVIYHTSSQRGYYEQVFPWILERSRFIRFGTDLDLFDPGDLHNSPGHGRYIICVGYAKRDWDTLVKAYKRLKTEIKLRLIGHVEERYSGVCGIEQLPFIPIKELIEQIHNALFSVLPLETFNYSYGQMTLMQQMALGKCVIAAKVPSLVDYVQDGETAIFYEPKNVGDLSRKMSSLIEDRKTCEQIGRNGREYLLKNCNEKKMAAEIDKEILDVCKGHRR